MSQSRSSLSSLWIPCVTHYISCVPSSSAKDLLLERVRSTSISRVWFGLPSNQKNFHADFLYSCVGCSSLAARHSKETSRGQNTERDALLYHLVLEHVTDRAFMRRQLFLSSTFENHRDRLYFVVMQPAVRHSQRSARSCVARTSRCSASRPPSPKCDRSGTTLAWNSCSG